MPANNSTGLSITAVILAAGASRRMGGEDKGLLTLKGRPLIAHVLEHLTPQCNEIFLNTRHNQPAYAAFGYPLIEDTLPGGLGPLAGLLSALEHSHNDFVLSVPCDTPNLPDDLAERLLESLQQSGADVCTVDDGERLHPAIMLVRRGMHDNLHDYLEGGGRKVHDWFYRNRHCTADFSEQPDAFININTPEQLRTQESE